MRPILFLVFSSLFLASTNPAEAGRIGIRLETIESLVYAGESDLPGPDGSPLAICHYTRMQTAFWMGYWIEHLGMVHSSDACQGDSYITVDQPRPAAPAEADPGKDDAAIPEQAATEPTQASAQVPLEFSFAGPWTIELALHFARGYFWLYAIPLALLFKLASRAGSKRASRGPRAGRGMAERLFVLQIEDGPTFRFIDAMLHAAMADGEADPAEIAYIRDVARDLTGRAFEDDHIAYAMHHCDRLRSPRDFARFGHGLAPEQKRMVMRGVISVLHADQELTAKERKFQQNLSKALGISSPELDQLLPATGNMIPA